MGQRTKPTKKKPPSKRKPKKTWLDSLRKFLAKNRDILLLIGVIIAALTLIAQIYLSSAQNKP